MADDWINADGLYLKFGTKEAKPTDIGEYGDFDPGSVHLVEVELTPESLHSVGKIYPGDTTKLPKDFYLKKAEIFVEEAFVGVGMTIDFGIDNADRTVRDADGIDAAVATASLTAGATITCDGDLVNTRVTSAKDPDQSHLVAITVNDAAPSAGKGWLRLWYYLERV